MAALLNPMPGIKFFWSSLSNPLIAIEDKALLARHYDDRKALVQIVAPAKPIATPQAPSTQNHTRFYRTSKKDPNVEVNELDA